jgi:hypothetical protein
MSKLSNKFFIKLKEICEKVSMKPEDVLLIMSSESGLNPAAGNHIASGLIAATTQTLSAAGFTGSHKEFAKLQDFEQLNYVEKILEGQKKMNGGKPFSSAAQYYCSNFLPSLLSRKDIQAGDSNAILVDKNAVTSHIPGQSAKYERLVYQQNPGLDEDKDGKITFGDLERILDHKKKSKLYQDALKAYYMATNSNVSDNESIKSDNKDASKEIGALMNQILTDFPKSATKIIINHNDSHCAVEFSKIASLALYEEFNLASSIHSDRLHCTELSFNKALKPTQKQAVALLLETIEKHFNKTLKKSGFTSVSFKISTGSPYASELTEHSIDSMGRLFALKVLGSL